MVVLRRVFLQARMCPPACLPACLFPLQLGGTATLLTPDCENAVDVSSLSLYPHEAESLLLPGTKLQVVSRKKVGSVAHIHVREVA